ncbi:hypothetical protein ABES03_16790 [Neobacillus rhizosphaerae]|uniref:hypothetical protein n=1 Tax=Neobacillus rhizosphaerae TaxID=2880965 RepID=UPI003D2CAA21
MAKTELQNEFNDLVKSISDEVLSLTVSKSIENASVVFEKKMPELNRHVDELRIALESLRQVSQSISQYEGNQKNRDTIVLNRFDMISKQADSNGIKADAISELVIENKTRMEHLHQSNTETLDLVRNDIRKNHDSLEENLDQTGLDLEAKLHTNKKLAISNLIFSIGSFGLLVVWLLQSLGIVKL